MPVQNVSIPFRAQVCRLGKYFADAINITLRQSANAATEFGLFDSRGAKVASWYLPPGQQQVFLLSLDGLPVGMYFVRGANDANVYSQKVIVGY